MGYKKETVMTRINNCFLPFYLLFFSTTNERLLLTTQLALLHLHLPQILNFEMISSEN